MQIVLVASVILLSVLVGAALPTLLQLRSTLKSAQNALDEIGPELHKTLQEASETMERVNRMAAEIEDRAKKAEPIVDAALEMGNHVVRLGGSIRTAAAIGSALGPAVGAALRAIVSKPDGENDSNGRSTKEESA